MNIVIDYEVTPELLAKAKDFCRIDNDYTGEDETLKTLIGAAINTIEGATNLCLFPKTLSEQVSDWQTRLLYGPHISIVSVKDSDGVDIPTDDYIVSGGDYKTISFGGTGVHWFYPINGDPIVEVGYTGASCPNATVVYEAGYLPDTLPSGLLHLVLRLTDYYYTNRGSYTVSLPKDISTECRRFARQIIL